MRDDWQVGDLALCVKLDRWSGGGPGPLAGYAHDVAGVKVDADGETYLVLTGWPPDAYWARWFIKLRPHIPDAEDEETIRLFTGQPITEPA